MKFLVDVNVSFLTLSQLHAEGQHDFLFVRDLDKRMKDLEIIHLAEKDQRIVITGDKDFGELVFLNQEKHSGVLLLRFDELDLNQKIEIVEDIISMQGEKLFGRFSVYKTGKLRMR